MALEDWHRSAWTVVVLTVAAGAAVMFLRGGRSAPPSDSGSMIAAATQAGPDASSPRDASDPDVPLGADTAPPDPAGGSIGRVYFGMSTSQNAALAVEELYVGRHDGAVWTLSQFEEHERRAELGDGGRLQVTIPGYATRDMVLYEDGSFDGEERFPDGSKGTWVRTPFRPVGAGYFTEPVGLAGFLSGSVRYRVKIGLQGDEVVGVARYPGTRLDLGLHGTIDRASRVIHVDESTPDGRLTGHIEAVLVGQEVEPPYHEQAALVGEWSSMDGSQRRPLFLREEYYPDRVAVAGGRALAAQEIYERKCEHVLQIVYPVVDGAPRGVADAIDSRLKALSLIEQEERVGRMAPAARVVAGACPKDPNDRSAAQATFTSTPLHGSWVAVDIEHYMQEGGISGRVWHDCVAVDLATGSVVEPAALLDEATRTKLMTVARTNAIADVEKYKYSKEDESMHQGMLEAAKDLNLDSTPLCIDRQSVRMAIVQHRVFGPTVPVFDRAFVAKLLPEGQLKELVSP